MTDFETTLADSGEVGRALLAVDWEATPLGAPAAWPFSLKTMVRALLGSRFSMWMAWGPDLTFFCNDAYRRDTLARKYPWALGRPAREVWAEIWPDIGPRIESVIRDGSSTWDEALRLFVERSGYTEESYHTFSYSPLTDDAGTVAGMLCVVTEETERVIAERRMALLRDLGSDPTASLKTEAEVFASAARHLARAAEDLPFFLVYVLDDDGSARLACSVGVPAGSPVASPLLNGSLGPGPWPLTDALQGRRRVIDGLPDLFGAVPQGPWSEPPRQALLLPLAQPGQTDPYGLVVAGLNPFRPLDEGFTSFVELVAGQIAAGVTSARAYEAERRRAEQLAELDRAKTAFFTNISHEFRTPLTLLLGPLEDALAQSADSADGLPGAAAQQERLEVAHRNAQRLLRLVNTLLDFSRVESGATQAHYEAVDLGRYTGDLASMFRAAVERAGLTMVIDIEDLPEAVYVDRELWAQIVLNLLSNALKFTFEGSITIRVTHDRDSVVTTVSDTGVGIDEADQPRLFERFQRVVGARSRTHEGSGIGLALVAELAALHGGQVALHSEVGVGTTITVRLPFGSGHLAPGQVRSGQSDNDPSVAARQAEGFVAEALRWIDVDDAPGAGQGDAGATPGRIGGRRALRVLVVDDNADMRDYIASLLRNEYDVVAAADGMEALDRVRREAPDLIITDVMMPNLDGFGLLKAIRADPSTVDTPVVMLSARAGEDGTVEGLEAGADDYLVKPFSARELRARVRSTLELDRIRLRRDDLERSQALLDQAERLTGLGSWELDLVTGRLEGSDELVRLLGLRHEDLLQSDALAVIAQVAHPDDREAVTEELRRASEDGTPLDFEARLLRPDGGEPRFRVRGEVVADAQGRPLRIRGSAQDITEQHRTQIELANVAAAREVAAREHRIADELQRSLLPAQDVRPEHLHVATYYRAGVEGTQVGGDWYDVIELGAGRTALVLGDVMGRGVRAAAVMGQLRSVVRAYARLDLPPAFVLDLCDGVVRDLGEDQIVTCVYAVFDPADHSLVYANAGHLPPLLLRPGEETATLMEGSGPPLGAGPHTYQDIELELSPGSLLALYTDGLVERRGQDLDAGIEILREALRASDGYDQERLARLVGQLLPDNPDDDVALLLASVPVQDDVLRIAVDDMAFDLRSVPRARNLVAARLQEWQVDPEVADDAVLLTSELVTNAVVHGRGPVTLRVRLSNRRLVLEAYDGAHLLPHRLHAGEEDEHGRGLELVAALSERWGARPTARGKCVWCVLRQS
jgi:PAS domain S-box-containing protein